MLERRRRWSFGLQTLFVVVTVFGVGLGWVIWQRQIVRERRAMRSWLLSRDALVVPDMIWAELSIRGSRAGRQQRERLAAIQRQCPHQLPLPFVRRLWGDEPVQGIWLSDPLADRRREIERLFPESAIVLESEAIRDERIELARQIPRILSEPTSFAIEDAPLEDIVDYLKDLHNLEIQLDGPALEKAKIDIEVPLSFQAHDIPLHEALTKLLTPLKLTFRVRDDVLTVTTEDGVQDHDEDLPSIMQRRERP